MDPGPFLLQRCLPSRSLSKEVARCRASPPLPSLQRDRVCMERGCRKN
jgi:hypothetical protein